MQKSIEIFSTYNLNVPRNRWNAYVNSSLGFTTENILFMLCCWDYFYNPASSKAEGLQELFISSDAPHEINVGGVERRTALQLLVNPFEVNPRQQMRTRSRGRGVYQESTGGLGSPTHRQIGGIRQGGVGNYNLTTKAIEICLPVIMSKVDREATLAQVTGKQQPNSYGTKMLNDVGDFWGSKEADKVVGRR